MLQDVLMKCQKLKHLYHIVIMFAVYDLNSHVTNMIFGSVINM